MNVRNFFILSITLSMAGSQAFCLPNIKALFTEPAVRVRGTKALTISSFTAAVALLAHEGYQSIYSKNKYPVNRDRLMASGTLACLSMLSLWQNRRDRHTLADQAAAAAKAAQQQAEAAKAKAAQDELVAVKAKGLEYDEAEFNPNRPGLGLGGQACFNEGTKGQIQQQLAVLGNGSHVLRALKLAHNKPIVTLGKKKNDIKRQKKLRTDDVLRVAQQDLLPCINAYNYIMNRIAEPRKIFTMEINGVLRGGLPLLRATRKELLNIREFFKINKIELDQKMSLKLTKVLRGKIPQTLEVSEDVPSAFLNYYAKKTDTTALLSDTDDFSDDEKEFAGGEKKAEGKGQ